MVQKSHAIRSVSPEPLLFVNVETSVEELDMHSRKACALNDSNDSAKLRLRVYFSGYLE